MFLKKGCIVKVNEVRYSNFVEIQLQLFDAQLKFGLNNADGESESTSIYLSPQHMKVLSQMLSDAVTSYEKQFGTISLPEDMGVKVK